MQCVTLHLTMFMSYSTLDCIRIMYMIAIEMAATIKWNLIILWSL